MQSYAERNKERESCFIHWFIPQIALKVRVDAKSPDLKPDIPGRLRSTNTWAIFCSFPKHIIKELDWKSKGWKLNECSYGMQHSRPQLNLVDITHDPQVLCKVMPCFMENFRTPKQSLKIKNTLEY